MEIKKQSVSRCIRFTPGEKQLNIGSLMGPRVVPDALEQRKIIPNTEL